MAGTVGSTLQIRLDRQHQGGQVAFPSFQDDGEKWLVRSTISAAALCVTRLIQVEVSLVDVSILPGSRSPAPGGASSATSLPKFGSAAVLLHIWRSCFLSPDNPTTQHCTSHVHNRLDFNRDSDEGEILIASHKRHPYRLIIRQSQIVEIFVSYSDPRVALCPSRPARIALSFVWLDPPGDTGLDHLGYFLDRCMGRCRSQTGVPILVHSFVQGWMGDSAVHRQVDCSSLCLSGLIVACHTGLLRLYCALTLLHCDPSVRSHPCFGSR